LVQAALKQETPRNPIFDGLPRDSFNSGGVSEINEAPDNVVSIAHILRAEDSLGHAIIQPEDIKDAHIGHTDNVIQHLFKTVRNYSIDDTTTEQHGGPSDADITTAGGYLKQGMQDPDAHEGKKIQKRTAADLRLINQQTEQQSITRQLATLDRLIAESSKKIAALDEHIKEINEVQDILESGEDIDGSSPEAKSTRKKINKVLSKHGKTIDDYKDKNGKIDREKLNDDLERMEQETVVKRANEQENKAALEEKRDDVLEKEGASLEKEGKVEVNTKEIEANTQKTDMDKKEINADNRADAEHAIEAGDTEAIEKYAQDPANSHARPANLLQEEEKLALAQEHITANNEAPDEGMGLLAFFGFGDTPEEKPTLAANEQNSETTANETQTLVNTTPEETPQRSTGSFAALGDAKDAIAARISSAFSQASDPTTAQNAEAIATAEIEEEYAQQNNAPQQHAMTI